MSPEIVTTIHGITAKDVSQDEIDRLFEKSDFDDREDWLEHVEDKARARIAQSFEQDVLEMLEVEATIESDSNE